MREFPVLKTPRLLLREIRHSDAPALLAVRSDPAVMRFMASEPLKDIEEAHQQVSRFFNERAASASGCRWALERLDDQAYLGSCGVFGWTRQSNRCAFGYELGTFAWRQGYMQEAAIAILGWAFQNLALHRVEALIHPDNVASIQFAEKLGFQMEGRMRQTALWGGAYHDMLIFGLLQGERLRPDLIFETEPKD